MPLTDESVEWLLKNAGPVIKYRTATELARDSDRKTAESLKQKLLSDSLVQTWLDLLRPNFGRNDLHGAKTENYENIMGKLYEFGLRNGMKPLDERAKPFRNWLVEQIRLPNEGYFPVFYRTLVAAFLAMTGYSHDEAVQSWTLKRLDTVYPFAKQGKLDEVYVPQDSIRGCPKAFRNYPLLNPELYPDDEMKLPWIHDVNAFLHSQSIMEDAQLKAKAETVISLVLKPEYQGLREGYGTIRRENGKYYAMGWSIHLPAYFRKDVEPKDFGRLLLLLTLLKRSETAKEHEWFRRSVATLDKFKTEDGLTRFPRDFVPEKKGGCWVLGHRMGLEANRRTNKAIICESTFRHSKII